LSRGDVARGDKRLSVDGAPQAESDILGDITAIRGLAGHSANQSRAGAPIHVAEQRA
jgi:hypothetical protein